MNKPTLTVIYSTDSTFSGTKYMGHLGRAKRILQETAKTFDVQVLSCDAVDYSDELGVKHIPVPWLPRAFGWKHIVFYLWLIWQAPRLRGVTKVVGSNIAVLPIVRWLSKCPMAVTYEWDYADQTRRNEKRGLKYLLAPVLEFLALVAADLVFATTPRLETKARVKYGRQTVLLPNWVDLSQIGVPNGSQGRNDTTIIFAGRLHWSKGIDILIDAFARVVSSRLDARLTICGDGEKASALRAQADALGLAGVEFRGSVPNAEVLQLMRSAAIFVLPTVTREGHSRALIEAMACGLACVVTDVPGNDDVIVNGQTGLLVPPSDVGALTHALERLLSDRSFRARLAGNAVAEAKKSYDFRELALKEIQLLLDLSAKTS